MVLPKLARKCWTCKFQLKTRLARLERLKTVMEFLCHKFQSSGMTDPSFISRNNGLCLLLEWSIILLCDIRSFSWSFKVLELCCQGTLFLTRPQFLLSIFPSFTYCQDQRAALILSYLTVDSLFLKCLDQDTIYYHTGISRSDRFSHQAILGRISPSTTITTRTATPPLLSSGRCMPKRQCVISSRRQGGGISCLHQTFRMLWRGHVGYPAYFWGAVVFEENTTELWSRLKLFILSLCCKGRPNPACPHSAILSVEIIHSHHQ
jgi:hypothetical protein